MKPGGRRHIAAVWKGQAGGPRGQAGLSGRRFFHSRDREVEDRAVAVLEHSGGAVSLHHTTQGAHKPYTESFLIDDERDPLELSHGLSYISTKPYRMRLDEEGCRITDVSPPSQRNHDLELAESSR